MSDLNNKIIPKEATQAFEIILELLGSSVVGVYLYGSAVLGGLRNNSDVDILAVVNQSLFEVNRRKLVTRLMPVSGKKENIRLEVTVINHEDVVPWRYPPKKELIYGEWLRDKYEQGQIPEPTYDPDLAIILNQVRHNSISLFGRDASEILDPVPMADIRKAIKDCLPGLIQSLKGDERNVILTLARMWLTAATGEFAPKDVAAGWAIPQMHREQAALLDLARKAYRGEVVDKWEGLDSELIALVNHMKKSVESYLSN